MAEKARSTFLVDNHRAYSNRRSGKNKCSDGEGIEARDRDLKKIPLCNGDGQEEELLCLWGIWTHGLSLQDQGRTRVADKRRLEYVGGSFERNYKHLNDLKEKENLESLD